MNKTGKVRETISNSKASDSGAKLIFGNAALCAQLLRDYSDIDILKDVKAEDIVDVTERFIPMFTEERNADVVKEVHLPKGDNLFMITLIEHKSETDYNVIMQLLRYMLYIWEDYEKRMESEHKGISRTKDFRKLDIPDEYLKKISDSSPQDVTDVIARVVETMLRRINVPEDEVQDFSTRIKEKRMGQLFENFEPYDVQATRAEARALGVEEGRKEILNSISSVIDALKRGVSADELSQKYGKDVVETALSIR